ncbi:hypothetical protein TRVA0_009S01772 [Trichomonascus vanleenenianus]|uniref:uncharacterized protein n=1 Tax=Trichomonascus vanleenenianus TaxID=2268995 RepID=UPI003EC97374
MSESIYDFFVEDTKNLAPLSAVLPDSKEIIKSKLWTDVLITYGESSLTFASMARPDIVYRIPLTEPRESDEKEHLHARIVIRLKMLIYGKCVKRVVWRFISLPPSCFANSAFNLMLFPFFIGLVQRVELDVADESAEYLSDITPVVKGILSDLGQMKLTLRHGDFSRNGFACQLIKTLDSRRGNWHKYAELHVEISKIVASGRKELERVSPVIESITIHRLVNKGVFYQLIQLIRHTRKEFKIYINSFEIPGETAMQIPRGNLSLSIRSVSSKSMVLLSCDEQLACLTVTESAAKCLSGLELDLDELRVAGKPSTTSLQRITAQFGNVSNATNN